MHYFTLLKGLSFEFQNLERMQKWIDFFRYIVVCLHILQGDKLNLDDIFSALSNTEKQEKGIQSEAIQSASEQEDPGESALEGKGVTTEKSENIDKSEDAGETAQVGLQTVVKYTCDDD